MDLFIVVIGTGKFSNGAYYVWSLEIRK